MAKKQKMRNFLVALFFSLLLLSTFINPSDYQKTFQATLFLWVICHSFACSALYRGQYPSGLSVP